MVFQVGPRWSNELHEITITLSPPRRHGRVLPAGRQGANRMLVEARVPRIQTVPECRAVVHHHVENVRVGLGQAQKELGWQEQRPRFPRHRIVLGPAQGYCHQRWRRQGALRPQDSDKVPVAVPLV
eukprot:6741376-Lingulodinium_polyedra.AAC.1